MKLIYILKVCVLAAFVGSVLTGILFIMHSSDEEQLKNHVKNIYDKLASKNSKDHFIVQPKEVNSLEKVEPKMEQKETNKIENDDSISMKTTKIPKTTAKQVELKENVNPPSVHIFYYPWYGTPSFNDGKYYHWNHPYLKMNPEDTHKYPEAHIPPGDIASQYYPLLGPYSSSDPAIIERHLKWLSSAGIDVLSVSWYPDKMADENGESWDHLMPLLLNITEKYKMKISFHLEPYKGRTSMTIRNDIEYILRKYGQHPAFYRTIGKTFTKKLPLFYVYDSYLIPVEEWQKILLSNGSNTIRNTDLDSLLIGLYVNRPDSQTIKDAGFDGLYTYFAADGFSYGSTMTNWASISEFCVKNNLLFVPSVGPGYNDTRVRSWNSKTTRDRQNGEYYKEHFKMAHTTKADIVSITSFNEWHEGTQIEPAQEFTDTTGTGFKYPAYEKGPEQYLEITLDMIKTYFTPHHENIPGKIARIV